MHRQFDHKKIVINEATLKEFFNVYADDVCTFLNYYTHDRQLIEDIIQDIFIRLWEERDILNIFFIKTYLYNAARNRMLNHLRNDQNRLLLLEEWASREIEEQKKRDCVNREEFGLIYQQAINELPEKCREIFMLSKEQKKTYKEIATEKALSVKTIEAQMSIAIRRIREYMLKYYGSTNGSLPVFVVSVIIQGLL